MISSDEDHKEPFKVLEGVPDEFDPQNIADDAEKRGYCVLSIGENVDINGGNFKILSMGKKEIRFKSPDNLKDLNIKPYKKFKIKNGNFLVKSCGIRYLIAMGTPSTYIIDQKRIDDARKAEIEHLRKQKTIEYSVSKSV